MDAVLVEALAQNLPGSVLSALAVYVAVRMELRSLVGRLTILETEHARVDERTKDCISRKH